MTADLVPSVALYWTAAVWLVIGVACGRWLARTDRGQALQAKRHRRHRARAIRRLVRANDRLWATHVRTN